MGDFEAIRAALRADVEVAIQTWEGLLLETLGANLLCLYAKGSAVKDWESAIDYVPELSDLDLHVHTSLAQGLSADRAPQAAFDTAMQLSTAYEERFRAARPEAFHVPRTQLVLLNDLLDDPEFVLAPSAGLRLLRGALPARATPPPETLRAMDRRHLLELAAFLDGVPLALVDRTGIDLWTLVRRMTWRVSPSPVRLLALSSADPLEVWSWNRTRVATALEEAGYGDVAASYRAWYAAGWRAFERSWRDGTVLRELIGHGYAVLKGCLEATR